MQGIKSLDYEIMCHGFLKPFRSLADLERAINSLRDLGYIVVNFDCENWFDKRNILFDFQDSLDLPSNSENSWDALQECLNELELKQNGIVLSFENFDLIPFKLANTVMNICVSSAQRHLLDEGKLLSLIHLNNYNFKLEPFGAFSFHWY